MLTTGWWNAFRLPFEFTLENYQQVLTENNMAQSFVNSLLITIPATVIPILVAAFAAYAFAWMDFPGRNVLFILVVGLLVIPLQSALIPVLQFSTTLGITGTFPAVWLAHTGLRAAVRHLPAAQLLRAAAQGDVRIGLPGRRVADHGLLPPGAATVRARHRLAGHLPVHVRLERPAGGLILVGGNPDVAPMTVTIANLVNSLGQGYHLLTAAAFISMILPLVVFFSLQRYFVRGILGRIGQGLSRTGRQAIRVRIDSRSKAHEPMTRVTPISPATSRSPMITWSS